MIVLKSEYDCYKENIYDSEDIFSDSNLVDGGEKSCITIFDIFEGRSFF